MHLSFQRLGIRVVTLVTLRNASLPHAPTDSDQGPLPMLHASADPHLNVLPEPTSEFLREPFRGASGNGAQS
eukprot:1854560-Lingulodinium_polyedra.AAC.1